VGQRRQLTEWQASYIRRAVALRRRLGNKQLADHFGIARETVSFYAYRKHKTQDQGRAP